MSQDLASLYIKIDSTGVVTASKELDKLAGNSKKAESATQSLGNQFGQLRRIVESLAAAYGALKLAQYIKDATMLAARYETLGVVMRVVGANAGYSGSQMDEFAKGLQRAGIAMVESRNTLARMIQAQIDLKNATQLARVAQDAAVIGNINSSEAFQRMVYGIQSGQVEILRTIGINVNFENSYQKVAKATGRVTAQLSEAEKSQIRMNAVMDAGQRIAGTYESAMGTAGKQVLSLQRHLDNLKVGLGAAFTPALAEIVESITGAVEGLNKELTEDGAEKIQDWGNEFRLVVMSIEAEIMRLSMFIDKIGGTLTSMQMLLYGPGRLAGVESSTKRFEAAADANIKLEERYKATEKALEALAEKYNKLEQAMTPEGKAKAKAILQEMELAAEAARATSILEIRRKAIEAGTGALSSQDRAMQALISANKDLYESEVAAADHALAIKTAYGEDELNFVLDVIRQKEDALNKWYEADKEAIENSLLNSETKSAKLTALDAEYHKLWMGYENEKAEKIIEVSQFMMEARQSYTTWDLKQQEDSLESFRRNRNEIVSVSEDAWDNIYYYQKLTGKKIEKDQIESLDALIYEYENTFIGGYRKALLEIEGETITSGKFMEEITKEFADASSDAMSDLFFDAFKGEIDSLSDYWDSFTDAMLRKFTDMLADLIVQWVAAMALLGKSSESALTSAISSVLGVSSSSSTGTSSGSGILNLSGISNLYSALTTSASGWGLATTTSDLFLGVDTSINWANVASYVGLAYEAYSFFQDIGDQQWLSAAGTALGTAIGSISGGVVGAALGAGIGDLVGSMLDSILGLGASEPTFTLAEHNTRYSGSQASWVSGMGIGTGYWPEFSSNWSATPTVAYTAIAKAYASGRKELAETFNESMLSFLETLPSEYAIAAEDALSKVDFQYLIPEGEWDFSNAEEVVTALLQGYADFLDQVTEDLVRQIGKMYYTGEISTSDLFSKLTSGTQSAIESMFMGGEMTSEDFSGFLDDWNTLLGVLSSFEALLDPSTAALTTYEQTVQDVGTTFDAYVNTLRQAGVAVDELWNLETERTAVIEREVKALQTTFWTDFMEQMKLNYSGMTDYEKEVYKLQEAFQEYYDSAVDLGMGEEYLAQIREWEKKAIDQLSDSTEDATDSLESMVSAFESLRESLTSQYMEATLSGTGYSMWNLTKELDDTIASLNEWLAAGAISQADFDDMLKMAQVVYDKQAELIEEQKAQNELELQSLLSVLDAAAGDTRMAAISQRYGWANWGKMFDLGSGNYNWANIIADIQSKGWTTEKLQELADYLGLSYDLVLSDLEYLVDTFDSMRSGAGTLLDSINTQWMKATMTDEEYQRQAAWSEYVSNYEELGSLYANKIITKTQFQTALAQIEDIYQAEIESIAEAEKDKLIDIIESAYDSWKKLADSIHDSILSLQTSSDNQADVFERLGIQAQAIRDYTGGMSLENYLASLGNDEDRQNAINDMMDLWGGYLDLAQEAYQRPSSEYQAIYAEVLAAYQQMEGLANNYVSDYDIQTEQLEVLKQIAANTGLYGSYDTGIDYVPKTGPYLLHQGEKVTRAGESSGDVYITVNVSGATDPEATGQAVRREVSRYMRYGEGRRIIQEVSVRH